MSTGMLYVYDVYSEHTSSRSNRWVRSMLGIHVYEDYTFWLLENEAEIDRLFSPVLLTIMAHERSELNKRLQSSPRPQYATRCGDSATHTTDRTVLQLKLELRGNGRSHRWQPSCLTTTFMSNV